MVLLILSVIGTPKTVTNWTLQFWNDPIFIKWYTTLYLTPKCVGYYCRRPDPFNVYSTFQITNSIVYVCTEPSIEGNPTVTTTLHLPFHRHEYEMKFNIVSIFLVTSVHGSNIHGVMKCKPSMSLWPCLIYWLPVNHSAAYMRRSSHCDLNVELRRIINHLKCFAICVL